MARELDSLHGRLDTLFKSLNPVLRADSRLPADPLGFLQPSPSSASHPSDNAPTGDERDLVFVSAPGAQDIAMTHQVMKANLYTTRAVARMLFMSVLDYSSLKLI